MLVHRLIRRHILPGEKVKFSSSIGFDYMGSAEFEWGIVPASIRLMKKMPLVTIKLKCGLWFVGDQNDAEFAQRFCESQINGEHKFEGRYLQERTGMQESVIKDKPAYIGWFWLSQDGWPDAEQASKPTWCVFLAKEDAELWINALKSYPDKSAKGN